MWINEPEADDGAFDSDRAAGVVDTGDRVMRVYSRRDQQE
jgi:hypothetical protein